MKNHVTFGGPDVHKLQKTAEIAGFDVAGSLPESEIKEIEAAKMKAVFSKIIPKTTKPKEKNKVLGKISDVSGRCILFA